MASVSSMAGAVRRAAAGVGAGAGAQVEVEVEVGAPPRLSSVQGLRRSGE